MDPTVLGAASLQLLVMGGTVALVLGLAHRQIQRRDQTWQSLAERRGLQLTPGSWSRGPEAFGEIDGRPVRVGTVRRGHGKSSTTYSFVRVPLLAPVPPDLRLAHEGLGSFFSKVLGGQDIQTGNSLVDKSLRISGGAEHEIRQALTQPDLVEALGDFRSSANTSRVEGSELTLELRGIQHGLDLDALVDRTLRFAAALDQAFRGPWQALAQRLGLAIEEQGGNTHLHGEIAGLRVDLDAHRGIAGLGLTVEVQLPQPLPTRCQLRCARKGEGPPAEPLGDPVLDGVLRAEGGGSAVRGLIAAAAPGDDLHGLLLAVLHAWPGATVDQARIRLVRSDADAAQAEAQLRAALDLAGALRRAIPA